MGSTGLKRRERIICVEFAWITFLDIGFVFLVGKRTLRHGRQYRNFCPKSSSRGLANTWCIGNASRPARRNPEALRRSSWCAAQLFFAVVRMELLLKVARSCMPGALRHGSLFWPEGLCLRRKEVVGAYAHRSRITFPRYGRAKPLSSGSAAILG